MRDHIQCESVVCVAVALLHYATTTIPTTVVGVLFMCACEVFEHTV
jgi:hypothetical protein